MKKMSKRTLITAAVSVALAATLAAGGSLAYFTSTKNVTNTITFGNVSISLTEPGFNKNTALNAIPGDTIVKDPTIENDGTNPCYLRVRLDIDERSATGSGKPNVDIQIEEITNLGKNTDWVKSGDYYYYQKPLAPKAKVVLFNELLLPTTWGNDYAGVTFDLKVTAEAIQTTNFAPDLTGGKITGWSKTVA